MTNPIITSDVSAPASVRQRERPTRAPSSIEQPGAEPAIPRAPVSASLEHGTYEVGYGKPPKHSQFKPGQSGNPKGRPKGAKSPFTVLRDELQNKVVIKERGKLKKVSNLHAIMKRMVADTLSGKPSQMRILFTLLHIFEAQFTTTSESPELSPEDKELVLSLLQGVHNE